ncbi:unnamed protein product, partial [Urochloa humidicola]
TTLICKLFATQVQKGNRPNTHLNSAGYEEVADSFYQRTGIHATKLQLKNKWDKLKPDFIAWQKVLKCTGLGRNAAGEIVMDKEWWKKTKKDIPGSFKFKKRPLQNEEELKIMFGQITNDESDHWNPMSCNPIIPPSQDDIQGILDDTDVGDEQIHEGFGGEETNNDEAEELATSPSVIIGTRKVQGSKIAKKPRVGTTLVIQEKISKIA